MNYTAIVTIRKALATRVQLKLVNCVTWPPSNINSREPLRLISITVYADFAGHERSFPCVLESMSNDNHYEGVSRWSINSVPLWLTTVGCCLLSVHRTIIQSQCGSQMFESECDVLKP